MSENFTLPQAAAVEAKDSFVSLHQHGIDSDESIPLEEGRGGRRDGSRNGQVRSGDARRLSDSFD